MKKILMIAAASAALMTGCSQSSEVIDNYDNNAAKATEETPVTFGTYLSSAVTRAGKTGTMDLSALQTSGFGIFAYHTDGTTYSQSATPNFMWNQKVEYNKDEAWTYSPLKYWPNETGASSSTSIDSNGATTTGGTDKLTFFAYAPYISAGGSDGAIWKNEGDGTNSGIKSITSNNTAGDPKINYTVSSDPSKSVDLLWGVIKDGKTWNVVDNTSTSLTAGKPYLNMVKPKYTTAVEFNFLHALAKLNFTVQGAFNEVTTGSNNVDDKTKITVESVAINGASLASTGTLNLNNTTESEASWTATAATGGVSFTVNSSNGLNEDIEYNNSSAKGVDKTAKNLFKTSDKTDRSFMVIPTTTDLTITITYYVTTTDGNLKDGKSEVKNVITKKIGNMTLANGKSYTFALSLGMETVSVSASVTDWGNGDSKTVDLPINVADSSNSGN